MLEDEVLLSMGATERPLKPVFDVPRMLVVTASVIELENASVVNLEVVVEGKLLVLVPCPAATFSSSVVLVVLFSSRSVGREVNVTGTVVVIAFIEEVGSFVVSSLARDSSPLTVI